MVNGTTAKLIGWYDNEWAYSCRVVELAALTAPASMDRGSDGRSER